MTTTTTAAIAWALVALVLLALAAAWVAARRARRAERAQRELAAQHAALLHELDALRRAMAAARVGVWQADADGTLRHADETARSLWQRADLGDGKPWPRLSELRAPEHRAGLAERLREVVQRHRPLVRLPNLIVRGGGDRLWVSTTAVPLLDEHGTVRGLLGCDVDIDTRQRLLLALQAAERRYRLLAEHTQSIIYTIDAAGHLTYVSPSWTALLGHPVEEVIGRDFRPFVHPEDVPLCEDFLARTLRERRVLPPLTYRVRHRDGRVRYHRSVLAPVLDDDGRLQAVVGNAIDISTDVELRAELERVATHDALTGAANRRLFLELLQREIERARRHAAPLGLLMLDLDHFKAINDTHGHAAGDAVLRGFVQRCGAALRPSDVLGRLGGEEFAAMLPGAEPAQIGAIAERLRAGVAQQPFALPGGATLVATVSVGAVAARPDEDADALLMRADRALYEAKRSGRDRVLLDGVAATPAGGGGARAALPPFPPLARL